MTPDQKKTSLEERAQKLLGQRLAGVKYFQIAHGEGQPWWHREPFDTVDFGLDLEMESGQVFGVVWDWTFIQHGLTVYEGSLSTRLSSCRVWDVATSSRWASLIGRSVTNVTIHWSVQDGGPAIQYPQDITIGFDDGRLIFLSASQYDEQRDTLSGMADEVTVVFSDDVAMRYHVGPYALTESGAAPPSPEQKTGGLDRG